MVLRRGGLIVAAALAVAACRPPIYDIDRMPDPVQKARYSCQYLLERALATEAQKDADGVLRRRIADFDEPAIARDGDRVTVTWPTGGVRLQADGSVHGGGCVISMYSQGRRIEAVTLDGRALHAGFGM